MFSNCHYYIEKWYSLLNIILIIWQFETNLKIQTRQKYIRLLTVQKNLKARVHNNHSPKLYDEFLKYSTYQIASPCIWKILKPGMYNVGASSSRKILFNLFFWFIFFINTVAIREITGPRVSLIKGLLPTTRYDGELGEFKLSSQSLPDKTQKRAGSKGQNFLDK